MEIFHSTSSLIALKKDTFEKVDINEPIYRVWHNGPLETTDKQPQRIGSPTDTQGINPNILQQAEAYEDKHNIVEDTREVFKKVNEELLAIKKKERRK